MEFINNPWVAGIGAGVISGLVVFWITRSFFSKRDKREYFQKISAANREVLYAIRPGISEGQMPTLAILEHLITATARKYGVEQESMFTVSEIASELIKEVMDSAFISTSMKIEFCNKLSVLSDENRKKSIYSAMKGEYDVHKKYQKQLSSMIAAITMLTTMMAVFFVLKDEVLHGKNVDILLSVFSPAAIAITIAASFSLLFELRKRSRNINDKSKSEDPDSARDNQAN